MSQFTIYQSGDSGAPTLNGLTGSLLNVLNSCLVYGYGSNPGAGWTKPFPDTASYGCFQLPSGTSTASLFVNDTGPSAATGEEARLTGWMGLTSILAGNATGSIQFPTSAQLAIGVGAVVARKSSATTSASISWIMFADSASMYFHAQTGDSAGVYLSFMFGDIYSFNSASIDVGRCMIAGRSSENSATITADKLDATSTTLSTALAGNFMAQSFSGTGTGITISKFGDYIMSGGSNVLLGTVKYLNGPDGGIYISPVFVAENSTSTIRGVMRGFYHFCHAISNVTDGQQFTGAGDFAGKTFQVVKKSGNSGVYLMEISNTLLTN